MLNSHRYIDDTDSLGPAEIKEMAENKMADG